MRCNIVRPIAARRLGPRVSPAGPAVAGGRWSRCRGAAACCTAPFPGFPLPGGSFPPPGGSVRQADSNPLDPARRVRRQGRRYAAPGRGSVSECVASRRARSGRRHAPGVSARMRGQHSGVVGHRPHFAGSMPARFSRLRGNPDLPAGSKGTEQGRAGWVGAAEPPKAGRGEGLGLPTAGRQSSRLRAGGARVCPADFRGLNGLLWAFLMSSCRFVMSSSPESASGA